MDQPETKPTPTPIVDVSPPGKATTPAEAPLAEPPKEVKFTEVPPDTTQAAPVASTAVPGTTTGSNKPSQAVTPPPKATKPRAGSKRPVVALTVAVVLFLVLAMAAYYAYLKSR